MPKRDDFDDTFEIVAMFHDQISDLKTSYELLVKVYLELGPYTKAISPELRRSLNNYFGHDDSE